MRAITVTEKYRAVQEGTMSKKEFVRQMRQQYPMFVSNYDGFDSTVSILKTRNMLFEAPQKAFENVKVYDDRPALTYSLDTLDRGIRAELNASGIELPHLGVSPEDYLKAEKKAKDNLEKDPNHYINLLSGESSKVNKNDKPKEVKRGAADKDTFNDLKKATLKEGYTEEQINSAIERIKEKKEAEKRELPKSFADQEKDQIEKDAMKAKGMIKEDPRENIIAVAKEIRAKYGEIPGFNKILKDFLFTHQQEIKSGEVKPEDALAEFDNYIDANYDRLDEKDGEVNERVGSLQEFVSLIEDRAAESGFSAAEEAQEVIEALKEHYNLNEAEVKSHPDEIEDGTFPVAEAFKKVGIDMSKDVHVHYQDGGTAGLGGGQLKDKGTQSAESVLKMLEGIRKREIAEYEENKDKEGYSYEFPIIYEYYYLGDNTPEGKEFKMTFGKFEGESYDIFQESSVEEKKGKDHDGDGDIDGDDYMAAKDKAIKRAMGKEEQLKEAIKKIIKKTLNEDMLNEAATQELARIADDYAGFEGMKSAILDLENIVTDIEKYYDNTRNKIQKVYDRLGEIRNEEGLKVGGFLAPAIESAFHKDLRPVTKQGFTKGLETPKVKTLSQTDIDAARAAGDIEEEPKQTMFTPVNEKKK